MTGSGEHEPAREDADTERAPPPVDPEAKIPTWPKMPAVRMPRLDLKTDILQEGDEP